MDEGVDSFRELHLSLVALFLVDDGDEGVSPPVQGNQAEDNHKI